MPFLTLLLSESEVQPVSVGHPSDLVNPLEHHDGLQFHKFHKRQQHPKIRPGHPGSSAVNERQVLILQSHRQLALAPSHGDTPPLSSRRALGDSESEDPASILGPLDCFPECIPKSALFKSHRTPDGFSGPKSSSETFHEGGDSHT